MNSAVVLGVVQGATEFLPVSSSGHLVLFQEILSSDYGAAFDVALHFGTLLATLIFFRNHITNLTKNDLTKIIIASIPAALGGIILLPFIETLFSSILTIFLGFSFTTLLLLLTATRNQNSKSSLSVKEAFFIGLAQAVALIPGISRSGSTISVGLLQGKNKEEVFAFSFILSIPAILGATMLSINSISWSKELSSVYLVGAACAAITGYLSLALLKQMVIKSKFHNFAFYTGSLAILTLSILL